MNEVELAELTHQLAPIAAPPEPNWTGVICVLGSLAAVLIIWLLMRWLQRQARRYQGTRNTRIQHLQQAWQTGEYDSRRCAYELATQLRQGLGLSQLGPTPPAHLAEEAAAWQTTIDLLNQLRYRPDSELELKADTFEQVQAWLVRPC